MAERLIGQPTRTSLAVTLDTPRGETVTIDQSVWTTRYLREDGIQDEFNVYGAVAWLLNGVRVPPEVALTALAP